MLFLLECMISMTKAAFSKSYYKLRMKIYTKPKLSTLYIKRELQGHSLNTIYFTFLILVKETSKNQRENIFFSRMRKYINITKKLDAIIFDFH